MRPLLARAPLGSWRHINKERNRGQRAPSKLFADCLGRPIDLTQRLNLKTKRESRSLSSGNFERIEFTHTGLSRGDEAAARDRVVQA
jgi:hypothetical protein